VDLAWDAPEDNCSGISSYTVQVQIDPSGGAQGGGGEGEGEGGLRAQTERLNAEAGAQIQMYSDSSSIAGIAGYCGAAGASMRQFTVDSNTRLCTVGDLVGGERCLERCYIYIYIIYWYKSTRFTGTKDTHTLLGERWASSYIYIYIYVYGYIYICIYIYV
jgi:hypothetical protein